MKIKTLTNSILAVSVASLSGSLQAYDTAGQQDFIGTGQYETHTIFWKGAKNGEKGCPNTNPAGTAASFCVDQGGAELESSTVFLVENQWIFEGNGTTSAPIQAGGPTPAPVADCYTAAAPAGFTSSSEDGSFNALGGQATVWEPTGTATPSAGQGQVGILYAFSHRPQAFGAAGGALSRSVLDGPGDYQICTNTAGKIVSGSAVAYTNVPDPTTGATINVAAHYSWTQRSVLLALGCTAPPRVSDMEATITAFEAGTHAIGDSFFTTDAAGTVNGGCASAGWTEMAYLTCDADGEACGQLQKAVPVPAFAAAALGLGLFGITYLTARRRAVK